MESAGGLRHHAVLRRFDRIDNPAPIKRRPGELEQPAGSRHIPRPVLTIIPMTIFISTGLTRLSREFSPSRALSRGAALTSIPPYFLLQRKKVCSLMACARPASDTFRPLFSIFPRIRVICSALCPSCFRLADYPAKLSSESVLNIRRGSPIHGFTAADRPV
jgi:hypothetical protein